MAGERLPARFSLLSALVSMDRKVLRNHHKPYANRWQTLVENNKSLMEYAIKALSVEKDLLVEKLKSKENTDVNIERIAQIKKSIKWLNKISELKLKDVNKYQIVELPDMNTGYSEYRLMNDCETDDIKQWIEFKDHIGLTTGDFIISMKPQ